MLCHSKMQWFSALVHISILLMRICCPDNQYKLMWKKSFKKEEWAFLCWEFFFYYYWSNILISYRSIQSFYFFMIQSWYLYVVRSLSISSRLSYCIIKNYRSFDFHKERCSFNLSIKEIPEKVWIHDNSMWQNGMWDFICFFNI